MESMKTTREQTALLGPEQLSQAAFGTLCQSFAMGILAGARHEDGFYQQVALELLEEGAAGPAVQNILQVDLKLVLELLRKDGQKREKTRRLLEQLVRLELVGSGKHLGKTITSGAVPLRPAYRQQAGRCQRTGILRWPVSTAWDRAETGERAVPGEGKNGNSDGTRTPAMQKGARTGEPFFLTAGRRTLDALLAAGWKGSVLVRGQAVQHLSRGPSAPGGVHTLDRLRPGYGRTQAAESSEQKWEAQREAAVRNGGTAPDGSMGRIGNAAQSGHTAQTQAGVLPVAGTGEILTSGGTEARVQTQGETPVLNTASSGQPAGAGQTTVHTTAPSFGLGGAALFARWIWNRERPEMVSVGRERQAVAEGIPMQSSKKYVWPGTPPELALAASEGGKELLWRQEERRQWSAAARVKDRSGLFAVENGRSRPLEQERLRGRSTLETRNEQPAERGSAVLPAGVLTVPAPEAVSLEGQIRFPELAAARDKTASVLQSGVPDRVLRALPVRIWGQLVPEIRMKSRAEPREGERLRREISSTAQEMRMVRAGRSLSAGPDGRQNTLSLERAEMSTFPIVRESERSRSAAAFDAGQTADLITASQRTGPLQANGTYRAGEQAGEESRFGPFDAERRLLQEAAVSSEKAFLRPEETILREERSAEKAPRSTAEDSARTVQIRQREDENANSLDSAQEKEAVQKGKAAGRFTDKSPVVRQSDRMPVRGLKPGADPPPSEKNGVPVPLIHNVPPVSSEGRPKGFLADGELRRPAHAALGDLQRQKGKPDKALPSNKNGLRDIWTLSEPGLRFHGAPGHTSKFPEKAAQNAAYLLRTLVHRTEGQTLRLLERTKNVTGVHPLTARAPGTPELGRNARNRAERPFGSVLPAGAEGSQPDMPVTGAETALLLGVPSPKIQSSVLPGTQEAEGENASPRSWAAQSPGAKPPRPVPKHAIPSPEELTYGPVQVPAPGSAAEEPDSRRLKGPVSWGQRPSQSGQAGPAESPFPGGIGHGGGSVTSARRIDALPPTGGTAPQQIEWTAPGLGRRPAEIAYCQPEPAPPAPAPPLSGRELRRAADQVYRMIEDRLRRERRRLDL